MDRSLAASAPAPGHRPPAVVAGALFLFAGLSLANAAGGLVQAFFFLGCLLFALPRLRWIPARLVGLSAACGILAFVASMQAETDWTLLIKFLRPVLEGSLIALMLHGPFRIRRLSALTRVLAGYVLLQVCSAAVMVLLPELRSLLLERWYADESYQQDAFQLALLFRGFGVSRHHLYGLPLAVGTIAALLLAYASLAGVLRKRFFQWTAFVGLLLVLVNARIGVMPVLFCYLLGLSAYFKGYFVRHVTLILPVLLFAVVTVARLYLGDQFDLIASWLGEGLRQFTRPSSAGDSTTIGDLGQMIFLPPSALAWMLGEGRTYHPGDLFYSDIGWVRLWQSGGLPLVLAVSLIYVLAIRRFCSAYPFDGMAQRQTGYLRGILFGILSATFLIATVKGESFAANEYSRLMMTLAVLAHLATIQSARDSVGATATAEGPRT